MSAPGTATPITTARELADQAAHVLSDKSATVIRNGEASALALVSIAQSLAEISEKLSKPGS